MRGFTDEAVVLKKVDFGEADRLLTLYTKNHGKIRALAKGVRRPTSRKGGHLDLLTQARIQFHHGRNFYLATEAKTTNSFLSLKREIKVISKAYYLCEIVDSLCPEEQSMPFVFDLLTSTLSEFHLSSSQKVWTFEFQILKHLGFITEEKRRKRLRSYIEEIIERELKTPSFYYSLLKLG